MIVADLSIAFLRRDRLSTESAVQLKQFLTHIGLIQANKILFSALVIEGIYAVSPVWRYTVHQPPQL